VSTAEERRIIDKIKALGYPLEVEVINQLMKERWAVQPQYTYADKQTGKIRSIDILVTCFLPEMKIQEMPRIAIECKKSENAWVFYCVDMISRSPTELDKTGINLLDIAALGTTSISLLTPFLKYNALEGEHEFSQLTDFNILQDIGQVHFFDANLPRAFVGHVVKKKMKEDEPDSFQKALHQLRGACLNLMGEFPKSPIVAVIVVQGQLYQYKKVNEREEFKTANHILYSTLQFLPDDFELGKHSFPPTIVDIVTDSYLPDYIVLIKKDLEILSKLYRRLKQGSNDS